jgi:hypothetical protein
LLTIAGCAEPTGSVSGQVRYKGAPLPYGQITVFREDGRSASSVIDGGSYEIHKVPVGKVTVVVQSLAPPGIRTMMFRPDGSSGDEAGMPQGRAPKKLAIPERYKDPAKSGLSLAVHAGEQTMDLDLQP